MTTILTAQFSTGNPLVLSGDTVSGYLILGLGMPSVLYGDLEDAFEDFGGYVIARTQEEQQGVARS